ncbi:hypothetical protein JC221_061 [Yersinia phage JC221]|nr:hypothetical protein JC221_061 [Yersinia phage JC221]
MTISNIEFKNAVAKPTPTNHVFVCDVSGSMYNELPRIRTHLKNNLATLVKPDDTVSILYFASKGQYGSVFVGEKVKTISDLSGINDAIDRFLRPTGCTGFVEPLNLAVQVATDLQADNGNLNSLIFLTDGYDNCWRTDDILKACSALPLAFNNIAFLEYGYYVNRPLLEKMAEATNALHKFVEGFDQYEPAFNDIISAQTSARIEVKVGDATHAIYIDEGRVYVVNAANGIALIPEHIKNVWAIGDNAINDIDSFDPVQDQQVLYVVLYHALHTMNPDLAWKVLKKVGDVRIIKAYDNCFTKQDYSNAKDLISSCVVDPSQRFVDGVDYNMVPDENAFTLVDALELLAQSDTEIDLSSPHWAYNRTGRVRVQKDDNTLDELSTQIANAQTAEERKALAAKMVDYEVWKPEFKQTTTKISVKHLVGNSSRPNISINTDLAGYVEIPVGYRQKFGLPNQIETKQVRNFTIVKDGIVNVKQLPLETDIQTLKNLRASGLTIKPLEKIGEDRMSVLVDFTSLPLINRAMTRGISGKEYVTDCVRLEVLKARQKVLKFLRDNSIGRGNAKGLADLYGEDAANWLSEQGIRDYGFSPKVSSGESTDVYMSKELNVKIKGASSLPAVAATVKKRDEGKKKLNNADLMIIFAYDSVQTEIKALDKDQLLKYLEVETRNAINAVRTLNNRLSRVMYGIVVGHAWFADLDFEETDVTVPGKDVNEFFKDSFECSIVLEEKEVKI